MFFEILLSIQSKSEIGESQLLINSSLILFFYLNSVSINVRLLARHFRKAFISIWVKLIINQLSFYRQTQIPMNQ